MTATLTEEQLKLRQQVLLILFREFGKGIRIRNQDMVPATVPSGA